MNVYKSLRSLLFLLDEELAHTLSLNLLRYLPKQPLPLASQPSISALGLCFAHPVGLAAGLDKDGLYINALAKLGFSFIEVGTVTPLAQSGNPRPRLFRLPKEQAIINRMGFNNRGVDALVMQLQKLNYSGILGINIGKNKDTSLANAANDYVTCFTKVYPYASYVTLNISSPNTQELRALQQGIYFRDLIKTMIKSRELLMEKSHRYVPLVVKVSPDESDETLKSMADCMLAFGVDGIIATNTTCDHSSVAHLPHGKEIGGLSGAPLRSRSNHCLKVLKSIVGDELTLIGAGGIDSRDSMLEKKLAGADLVQVYTGLIYQGPGLVRELYTLRT